IGQLTWVDAESFLSSFVFDGIIDELVFTTKVGSLLDKAAVSGGKSRRVRMFGEMVNFLWTDNPRAAERLEQLWNQLIGAHRVPVLCVYALAGTQAGRLPASLLACHSQAIG
ncbi:MAG TPA: hypothetical protein VGV35_05120, partial [Bryobacteraceae bacterium]|nr:hypothetical protein [Bryobacteraceae bacterium]